MCYLIQPGMTRDQVIALVGRPSMDHGNSLTWTGRVSVS
jgi:outer membrane protein assembly factor BamE (lipoprotein component of BamABCDE complex)